MFPATYTNSILLFLVSESSLQFQTAHFPLPTISLKSPNLAKALVAP